MICIEVCLGLFPHLRMKYLTPHRNYIFRFLPKLSVMQCWSTEVIEVYFCFFSIYYFPSIWLCFISNNFHLLSSCDSSIIQKNRNNGAFTCVKGKMMQWQASRLPANVFMQNEWATEIELKVNSCDLIFGQVLRAKLFFIKRRPLRRFQNRLEIPFEEVYVIFVSHLICRSRVTDCKSFQPHQHTNVVGVWKQFIKQQQWSGDACTETMKRQILLRIQQSL